MNFRHILLLFADLGASLALIPSSNTSLSPSSTDSHVLSAWPSHLPWNLPISLDLSINVVSYGHFVTSYWWDVILRNLDEVLRQFNMEGRRPGAKLGYRCYTYQFVLICFNDPADSPSTPMNPRIIPKDAGSIVNAVKDLYFLKYGTSPREIGVQIKKRGERQQNMNIRWLRDTSSRWPEPVDLPFMVRVRPDRFIQITWYSTDVYPSIARQVEETLQSFINEFATEGPLDRPPSKGTYTRTSGGLVTRLSIQIQGPAPGALIRLDMISFLKRIDELLFLPHDWDLREFRADLLSDRGNLGTMALTFDQTSS